MPISLILLYPLSIHRKILEKEIENLQIMIWYWWIPQDFSHKNDGQRRDMKRLLKISPAQYERQIYLVLSASTKYKKTSSEITNIYDEFSDFHLIFYQVDETSAYGNILNIKLHTERRLSM